MSDARRLLLAAVLAAVAVPCVYVAAGGLDYRPQPVASPCAGNAWKGSGLGQLLEQTAVSAIDGAACKLGVSQATLALALTSRSQLNTFAAEHHLTQAQIDAAARAGLVQAAKDGERAGKLNVLEAAALDYAAQNVPIDRLIQLARSALAGTGY